MNYNQKLLKLSEGSRIQIPNRRKVKKAALYDFNGTLVNTLTGEGMALYERKLGEQLRPLDEKTDAEIVEIAATKGIELKGKGIGKRLTTLVLDAIKKPKRGTKAREVYYDFMELALERGEMKLKTYPDVFSKGNFIEKDRKMGLKVISLSRGTDALLQKSLKAAKLDGIVEKIYSNIPYGGEKAAQAYFDFYKDMMEQGILIVKSYEDEWANVEEMMIADIALAIKLKMNHLPFLVYWIDRKKERKKPQFEEKIRNMEEIYNKWAEKEGWPVGFEEVLVISNSLKKDS